MGNPNDNAPSRGARLMAWNETTQEWEPCLINSEGHLYVVPLSIINEPFDRIDRSQANSGVTTIDALTYYNNATAVAIMEIRWEDSDRTIFDRIEKL